MIRPTKSSDRVPRWRAALLLPLGVLAALVIRQAVSGWALGANQPALSIAAYPSSAVGQGLAAEASLVAGDDREAAARARAALEAAPMQATALRVLAIGLAQLGDAAGGAAALKIAAAMGWRDTPTQLLLLVDALGRRDPMTAVQRADALARRDSQRPVAFAALRGVSALPGGLSLVSERLALRPDYRAGFLAEVGPIRPVDYPAREALLDMLAKSAPLAEADFIDFVHLLVSRKEYARARSDWVRWRGPRAHADLALQDPDFALASAEESGFGWRLGVVDGADAEAGGHGLNVWTNGAAVGVLAAQQVLLSPGAHVFRIDLSGAGDAARDAFRWRISCASSITIGALDLQPVARSADRTTFEARFTVPAAACEAQVVELDVRRPQDGEEVRASFAGAMVS